MARLISHMDEHDRRFEEAVKKALRLVGGAAERKAKETISDMEAVDTGFLRNSITYAVAGEKAHTGSYRADKGGRTGHYGGQAPTDSEEGKYTVYIGTNVEYAPYVELGTRKMPARPFLASSIYKGKEEYEKLFREAFNNFY